MPVLKKEPYQAIYFKVACRNAMNVRSMMDGGRNIS